MINKDNPLEIYKTNRRYKTAKGEWIPPKQLIEMRYNEARKGVRTGALRRIHDQKGIRKLIKKGDNPRFELYQFGNYEPEIIEEEKPVEQITTKMAVKTKPVKRKRGRPNVKNIEI